MISLRHMHHLMDAFEPPMGGLTAWASEKINYYDLHAPAKENLLVANIIRRVLAFAMPFFALLDTLIFIGKALFKAVLLQGKEAAHQLFSAGKAARLFATSLGALPYALISPNALYLTKPRWALKMADQFQEALNKASDLKTVIHDYFGPHPRLESLSDKISQASTNPQLTQHFNEFFGRLLGHCYANRLHPDQITDQAEEFWLSLLDLRNPELRLSLLDLTIGQTSWTVPVSKDHCRIFAFLASKLTSNQDLQKKLVALANRPFFKDRQKMNLMLSVTLKLLKHSLCTAQKEAWLEKLCAHTTYEPIKAYLEDLNGLLFIHNGPLLKKILGSTENKMNLLFKEVYGRDVDSEQIKQCQRPAAFALFHSRLMGLDGGEKLALIAASNQALDHVIRGLWQQERHNEAHNCHLQTIFTHNPGLKELWIKKSSAKVKDFLPSGPYDHYDIKDTDDPTDILMQGSDLNTCLHLEGRLVRMKGLIGYLLDGKTHTLVIKNESGKIVASTRLHLYWDDKNNKAVLFQDTVNTSKPQFRIALNLFCQKRAADLSLSLLSRLDSSKPYKGSVTSLGSSAPLEYVDSLAANIEGGIYRLKQSYIVI